MATWKSKYPIKYWEDMGLDCAECELSWQYNTTSDILMEKRRVGNYSDMKGEVASTEHQELYSNNRALAMLEMLIDWAETFEGEGTVSKLLKEREARFSNG